MLCKGDDFLAKVKSAYINHSLCRVCVCITEAVVAQLVTLGSYHYIQLYNDLRNRDLLIVQERVQGPM
jgi:hypothetical protein